VKGSILRMRTIDFKHYCTKEVGLTNDYIGILTQLLHVPEDKNFLRAPQVAVVVVFSIIDILAVALILPSSDLDY